MAKRIANSMKDDNAAWSGYLSAEEMQTEMEAVLRYLGSKSATSLTIMYGFGCDVDDPYKEIPIQLTDVKTFIKQGLDNGVWRLGDDDFHIAAPSLSTEFLFCHESDIHLTSGDRDTLAYFVKRWKARG